MNELMIEPNLPEELTSLITAYNQLAADRHVEKLFYLQKINYALQKHLTNPEVMDWRNAIGDSGWEYHLQVYRIHRDGSALLQSIEFAQALDRLTPGEQPETEPKLSFYSAMRERDELFKLEEEGLSEKLYGAYVQHNKDILKHYNANVRLHQDNSKIQDLVLRHKHYLGLSYAKIDAIQGLVQQQFDAYKTEILGDPNSRNRNFIFSIDTGTKKKERLVIRVEDRESLDDEQELQTSEVSQYFSEDYATLMIPFAEGEDLLYRPVVISEFATGGDLERYAEKLAGEKPKEIINKMQHFLGQLADFNLKLMQTGHFHPDIKLSNFLTDGNKLFVSDRKTLTKKKDPKVSEVESTEGFAAPEYKECIIQGKISERKARAVTLDMPSYMAYQTGMALKEWMIMSQLVFWDGTEESYYAQLDHWGRMYQAKDSDEIKNCSRLVQELTRPLPQDRLSMELFQILLTEIHLPSSEFVQRLLEVEKKFKAKQAAEQGASEEEGLSIEEDLISIEALFKTEQMTEAMKEKLAKGTDFEILCDDPRLDLTSLLEGKPIENLKSYLREVENLLTKADLEQANPFRRFLHYLSNGFFRVPRVVPLTSIDGVVQITDLTKAALIAAKVIQSTEIKPKQQKIFKELYYVLTLPSKEEDLSIESTPHDEVSLGDLDDIVPTPMEDLEVVVQTGAPQMSDYQSALALIKTDNTAKTTSQNTEKDLPEATELDTNVEVDDLDAVVVSSSTVSDYESALASIQTDKTPKEQGQAEDLAKAQPIVQEADVSVQGLSSENSELIEKDIIEETIKRGDKQKIGTVIVSQSKDVLFQMKGTTKKQEKESSPTVQKKL